MKTPIKLEGKNKSMHQIPAMNYAIGFSVGSIGAALFGASFGTAVIFGVAGAIAAHFFPRDLF